MAMEIGAQLRKGVVEYCVLGLLQHEPAYGWKLSEQLAGRGLIASIGTLYPVLARLRTQRLIEAWVEETDSGRPRKYYSLTADGEAQLQEFRVQWEPFAAAVGSAIGPASPDQK